VRRGQGRSSLVIGSDRLKLWYFLWLVQRGGVILWWLVLGLVLGRWLILG
jgi:hypothetical protein